VDVVTNGDSGWKLFRNQVFWDTLNAFLAAWYSGDVVRTTRPRQRPSPTCASPIVASTDLLSARHGWPDRDV